MKDGRLIRQTRLFVGRACWTVVGNRRLSITFSRGNFSAERIGNEDWRVDRRGDLFGRGPPGRHNFRRGPFYCVPSNRDSRPEILIISTLISSRVEINGTC